MRATILDPQAKEELRKAIRGLRGRLIDQLMEAAKGEYRLDVKAIDKAQLPEARRCRRERLEAWLEEQVRGGGKPKQAGELRRRYLEQAVKEAAHTLLNRLVFVRILEHHGLLAPAVVTGGWNSPAYEQEFAHYAGPLATDDTRGYRALLEVVFAELALELPGLFGPVGLTALFPVPAATLREVVTALNDPVLDTAWGDDTTLGWVYQYWNDPERERLDAKIAGGGKIEPHEIASKTQMFTERYMVEWLLQNSLGLTWLCICRKNGWVADAEAVLPLLEERRAEWRKKREAGEVALDALMPIEPGLESAWKYYVVQPIPEDAVSKAPVSIRDVKLLDPACGSGHFLVIAFGLLAEMYGEEARHRGEAWSEAEIAESILANNLHGIDIDPRAIQIAAAGLWLKAKLHAEGAKLGRMNLVAPSFRLGALPKDDPAVLEFVGQLEELGVPPDVARKLLESLSGVDHLGTLLRVDQAISGLLEDTDTSAGPLFAHAVKKQRAALESRVAEFLDAHAAEADLGLRLEGEQLAAGLRFVRLVKEGTYDVVVGNPPFLGTNRLAEASYVSRHYPRGKADVYAAFLERGLELNRDGGISALVGMRAWMFLGQLTDLRRSLLHKFSIRCLGDLDKGAFETMTTSQLISVCMSVIQNSPQPSRLAVALQPTRPDEKYWGRDRTDLKRAAVLAQVGRYEFDARAFEVIEGEPIVYWWSNTLVQRYARAPKLGDIAPVCVGLQTSDNTRFLRKAWEVSTGTCIAAGRLSRWVPYVKGASGRRWMEPLDDVVFWESDALALRVWIELYRLRSPGQYIKNEDFYFRKGIAFSMVGAEFASRVHRFPGVFGQKGSSVFPASTESIPGLVCLMNSHTARFVLQSLNPGIGFEVGDVNRLPIFPVANSDEIFAVVERSFTDREFHREPSVEFKSPGPSRWRYSQDWAQRAVDRPENTPLPPYEPECDPPACESFVSSAIGVALGRFGAHGEGILDSAPKDALPAGILFVSATDHLPDSLQHPATAPIADAWHQHQASILSGKKQTLRDWLRKDFFTYHKSLYENRPIYFPLSSEKRTFVAYVSIHRWADNTLQTLLADHLHPTLRQLDGEIADLNRTRASSDKKTATTAEKQYATVKKIRDELADFIDAVTQCAERGAPATDPSCPPRKADAPFRMDLDDGVMINSAALWPLLAPLWSDPKKWWKQLCLAEGKKDYDWARLARRYFPDRVEEKCNSDPSLAVAHGCFWKYHPAKAYAWELRLQDEIRPDFTIDEDGSDEHRARFLSNHPADAAAIREKEQQRRARKAAKGDQDDQDAQVELDSDVTEDETD